jgi:hypothetical protein
MPSTWASKSLVAARPLPVERRSGVKYVAGTAAYYPVISFDGPARSASAQAEFLDSIPDLIAVQPEQGGGLCLVPLGALKRLDDETTFQLL